VQRDVPCVFATGENRIVPSIVTATTTQNIEGFKQAQ